MKKSGLIGQCLLITASVLLLPSTNTFAYPPMSSPGGMMSSRHSDFDWVKHTQQTLDDLKGKLNLKPEQMPAWDTWAAGVIADANQQLEKDKPGPAEATNTPKALIDQTTPQRMARGIERLRAQTNWMQAQLARLDAAQVRTKTFYDVLDPQQKTIFDLFWTVMHHRFSGHDGGQMPMHMFKHRMDGDQDETGKQ